MGFSDITCVDSFNNSLKLINASQIKISNFIDKKDFFSILKNPNSSALDFHYTFHQGACSDTTCEDGNYIMQNNFTFSKLLADFCLNNSIPMVYASSASVYGDAQYFIESKNEKALNYYAYSKLLFDEYIREKNINSLKSQIVGLRYFNVYGPYEEHKSRMASVIFHFYNQIKNNKKIKIFEGSHGLKNGEHKRDFVHVDNVVDMNLWFFKNNQHSGIFNCGTSIANSYNKIANLIIEYFKKNKNDFNLTLDDYKSYIKFPADLKDKYQPFTESNNDNIKSVGYNNKFYSIEEGVRKYLKYLDSK
jgi:ADP-L-glycero-D-manno-heptose 6-epimerase